MRLRLKSVRQNMDIDGILDTISLHVAPFSVCMISARGLLDVPRSTTATLHYVLAGEGSVRFAGAKALPVVAGDLVLLPAAASHRLLASEDGYISFAQCRPASLGLEMHYSAPELHDQNGMTVLCASISLGLKGAGEVIDLLRTPIIEPQLPGSAPAMAMSSLLQELSSPGLGSRPMIRLLLQQCVLAAMRRRLAIDDPAMGWLKALIDTRLWPALAVMIEKPGHPHSVESLAETVNMSRARFAARFTAAFQAAPIEVLRGLRLQAAARALLESDAGIDRVAEQAGFQSRSHFTRAFTARFGKSPGQYRRDKSQP